MSCVFIACWSIGFKLFLVGAEQYSKQKVVLGSKVRNEQSLYKNYSFRQFFRKKGCNFLHKMYYLLFASLSICLRKELHKSCIRKRKICNRVKNEWLPPRSNQPSIQGHKILETNLSSYDRHDIINECHL